MDFINAKSIAKPFGIECDRLTKSFNYSWHSVGTRNGSHTLKCRSMLFLTLYVTLYCGVGGEFD